MTLSELAGFPKAFVSPKIAAEFLCCDQYSLNLKARQAEQNGSGSIGCIRYYFAGRNLKLCKQDILSACGWKGGE